MKYKFWRNTSLLACWLSQKLFNVGRYADIKADNAMDIFQRIA